MSGKSFQSLYFSFSFNVSSTLFPLIFFASYLVGSQYLSSLDRPFQSSDVLWLVWGDLSTLHPFNYTNEWAWWWEEAAPVAKIIIENWPIYDNCLLHVGISSFFLSLSSYSSKITGCDQVFSCNVQSFNPLWRSTSCGQCRCHRDVNLLFVSQLRHQEFPSVKCQWNEGAVDIEVLVEFVSVCIGSL